MPIVKHTKSKEETTSSMSKRKKFLSKFRHKAKKTEPTPPAVVNVDTPRSTVDPTVLFQEESKTPAPKPKLKKSKTKLKTSWLSRTKWFTKMSDSAFSIVDADDSGEVDEKELYSGLLLIHLKLGCYAGPAACRPVDRKRVHDVFEKMDVDDSGTLDKEEFREVMMVLCSNIFTRVLVQWSMTLIIVPLVAQFILDCIYFINGTFWNFVTDLDEYSPVLDKVELFIESVRDAIAAKLPRLVVYSYHKIMALLDKVPESVWNTVPLTLLSCILGCLAVPYIIFKIDDYFQALADKKKESVEEESP